MPASMTRRCISRAGLNVAGRLPLHPAAATGAAPAYGAWPANPAGWSNCRPNDATFAAMSRYGPPPMKLVATPRPEKKDWKSIVGPCVVALRPPTHSTCATFRPARSADCAIDSAFMTPWVEKLVALENVVPLMWNVLLVEPCTPGHAPVARLYHPAPVFGGACVSRPFPAAWVPFFRNSWRVLCLSVTYLSIRSCRNPSDAKNTNLSAVAADRAAAPGLSDEADSAPSVAVAASAIAARSTMPKRLAVTCDPLCLRLIHRPGRPARRLDASLLPCRFECGVEPELRRSRPPCRVRGASRRTRSRRLPARACRSGRSPDAPCPARRAVRARRGRPSSDGRGTA